MSTRCVRILTTHLGVCVGVWACGSTTAAPGTDDEPAEVPATVENVAGNYHATSFVGGGYDVLALGGSLTLTLGLDGSLTGTLHVPAAAGGPLDADMAGSYTLSGNVVSFQQDVDTFVRDASWTWANGVLSGSWSGGGETVSVRLEH